MYGVELKTYVVARGVRAITQSPEGVVKLLMLSVSDTHPREEWGGNLASFFAEEKKKKKAR